MDRMSCRSLGIWGLLLVLFVLVSPLSCPAHETLNPNIIKFGVFPYKSPKTIIEMYGPLAAYLEKKLGKKIKISSAADANSFLEKARNDEYDLLLAAPPVYYKLRSSGYKAIARGIPTFHGVAIVRKDSEIKTIEQLKGKKVAAIGGFSFAGYYFLLPLLEEKGIDPQKDVDIQFLGKVDSVIYGVVNKKYDAGLFRFDALELPAFTEIREQVRVIVRSSEIPQFPFVVKKGMDESTITAIQKTLSELSPDRPEEQEILKGMQVKKIIVATDADYDLFYEQIKDTDYFGKP
ncbi:MAG: phosphate/phosphite/phosphonate ABC transporter substrate-binding protein [Proteobacteria bacterium]|nr:phosphate/phosphite/phosphonate ABC transporter substrate-binding protein [Pseudomonadota bacterium]